MKVTRRLKITVTRHRLVKYLSGNERVFCPACGCEIELQAELPDTALTAETILQPQETGLSRGDSAAGMALVPIPSEQK